MSNANPTRSRKKARKVSTREPQRTGKIRSNRFSNLRELFAVWDDTSRSSESISPLTITTLGKSAIAFGHPTLALEILQRGKAYHPESLEITYLCALSLVKAGSLSTASEQINSLISRIQPAHPIYPDAKSLEGRIAKDRWARVTESERRKSLVAQAAAAYQAAYEASGDYFPGINAATMLFLKGERKQALLRAREVQGQCLDFFHNGQRRNHWLLATLGESALLLGEFRDAQRWYARAAKSSRHRVADIASMRHQLKLLGSAMPVPSDVLDALFVPRVIVFTGHMLDAPGRSKARFPGYIAPEVAREVRNALEELDAGFGYCSAACGADIIFIEEMLKRDAEVHVTLPFNLQDFMATSVDFAGQQWRRRVKRTLSKATSVSYAVREQYLGDDILFEYATTLTQGAARLRAAQLETEAVMVAVVEKQERVARGGTQAAMASWQKLGLPIHKIDLRSIRLSSKTKPTRSAANRQYTGHANIPVVTNLSGKRAIKTMLFADMVGFSRLDEKATPAFFLHFLGEIANVLTDTNVAPDFVNTWGDGLFIVFDQVQDAAQFSLRLRNTVVRTDWAERGLPIGTGIRIGMHSGPVFPAFDPVIHKNNFFGSHVNRAARIEPVTAPGAIYVSEQTASLLAAEGARQVTCDYLGRVPLAKNFDECALYRLRATMEDE